MKYFSAVCLCLLQFQGLTQDNVVEKLSEINLEWANGSIILKDGTEEKGQVKYNEATSLLRFQDDEDSKALTARNLLAFKFFDKTQNKQRVFYSLEDKNKETELLQYYFFEVLEEFKTFAVLSKMEPVDIKTRSNGNFDNMTLQTTTTVIRQIEIIYFMDESGQLEPYLQIVEKDVDSQAWFDYKSTRNVMLNEFLFEKYAGKYWQDVEEYCKQNDLKLRRRSHFIKAVDYLASLVED
jgi:hypothetical protein